MIACRPSSSFRRSFVRPSIPLNDFSSVTPGPIFFKLHLEPCVKGGLKIYTDDYGPLIKMGVMLYMVKHFKIVFSRTQKALGLNLGI